MTDKRLFPDDASGLELGSGVSETGAYQLPGERAFWVTVFEGNRPEKNIFLNQIDNLGVNDLKAMLAHLTRLKADDGACNVEARKKGVHEITSVETTKKYFGVLANWLQLALAQKQAQEAESSIPLGVDIEAIRKGRREGEGVASEVAEASVTPEPAKAPRVGFDALAGVAKTLFFNNLPVAPEDQEQLMCDMAEAGTILDKWRITGLKKLHALDEKPDVRANLTRYCTGGVFTKLGEQLIGLFQNDIIILKGALEEILTKGTAVLDDPTVAKVNKVFEMIDPKRVEGGLKPYRQDQPSISAAQLRARSTVELLSSRMVGLEARQNKMLAELDAQPEGGDKSNMLRFYTCYESYKNALFDFQDVYAKLAEIIGANPDSKAGIEPKTPWQRVKKRLGF